MPTIDAGRAPPAQRSDALVIFGATGDLVFKKIFPALLALARRGELELPVIGVARSDWSIEQFHARARASVEQLAGFNEADFTKLQDRLQYIRGDYGAADTHIRLREALAGAHHPLHYLAIPPSMYVRVVDGLGKSGCAKNARVVVEKPFGRDLQSAQALSATLHLVFDESDIFRIDHFLGKESVQNLLVFRFANTFLEPIWNRDYVDRVEITMAESLGVDGRAGFYEESGAIRDVVQNHLMQVIGFLAMESPTACQTSIRAEQAKLFRMVVPLRAQDLVRGQYHGYRQLLGVAPDSQVETYASASLRIDCPRWQGVPFVIRSGKCLPTTMTEVVVWLKPPGLGSLCPGQANYVRFRLGPEVVIAIGAQVKQPGEHLIGNPMELTVVHHPRADEMGAYERLLRDAMVGDGTLFTGQEGVEAAWAVVQPILGQVVPVHEYQPGTWGPSAAEAHPAGLGGPQPIWPSPQPKCEEHANG